MLQSRCPTASVEPLQLGLRKGSGCLIFPSTSCGAISFSHLFLRIESPESPYCHLWAETVVDLPDCPQIAAHWQGPALSIVTHTTRSRTIVSAIEDIMQCRTATLHDCRLHLCRAWCLAQMRGSSTTLHRIPAINRCKVVSATKTWAQDRGDLTAVSVRFNLITHAAPATGRRPRPMSRWGRRLVYGSPYRRPVSPQVDSDTAL